MAGHIYIDKEVVELLGELQARQMHVVLLPPSFDLRDRYRQSCADAGVSIGVEIETPPSWLGELWALLGSGEHIVSAVERQLLMAQVLLKKRAGELAPLRQNTGTRHLLADIACDLLPYLDLYPAHVPLSDAQTRVMELMDAYAQALASRGCIELSQACVYLRAQFLQEGLPQRARCVILSHIKEFPAYMRGLLAVIGQEGELFVCLDAEEAVFADELVRSFGDAGLRMRSECASEKTRPQSCPHSLVHQVQAAPPHILELSGTHVRQRGYADKLARMASSGTELSHATGGVKDSTPKQIALVSSKPSELFDELAAFLAARNIEVCTSRALRFGESIAGVHFFALQALAEKFERARAGEIETKAWWPAPELADWLSCPLSGAYLADARALDKKLRATRTLTPDKLMSWLQSIQSTRARARTQLEADSACAPVPVVCFEVFQLICRRRFLAALTTMYKVACVLPASAFGRSGGLARQRTECTLLARAIDLLERCARELNVSQESALHVLPELVVHTEERLLQDAPLAQVRVMSASAASAVDADTFDALMVADMDLAHWSHPRTENAKSTLAAQLMRPCVELEPIAEARSIFARLFQATKEPPRLPRTTHTSTGEVNYPAPIWTEIVSVQEPAHVQILGEEHFLENFDPSGNSATRIEHISCLPPDQLSEGARSYLVLRALRPLSDELCTQTQEQKRASSATNPSYELVASQLSASQIESYCTCPLCWFVGSRVRPARLDAGFSGMEIGNFVHDVLYRLHSVMHERGEARVTPKNLSACLVLLREVFAEVRLAHAKGHTRSSGPLVAISAAQVHTIDQLLPQLEAVIHAEAQLLPSFEPRYLEYSFNGLNLRYAGRPLGGRIDRVDVADDGRAVVIDYKHRKQPEQFRVSDPTVVAKNDTSPPADDPTWLPAHTQTLIYAQALRRAPLGLHPCAALYFLTRDAAPTLCGAASFELVDNGSESAEISGVSSGFPHTDAGGTMSFNELLDRVEHTISGRLDALETGYISPAVTPQPSCAYNHALGFVRRDL